MTIQYQGTNTYKLWIGSKELSSTEEELEEIQDTYFNYNDELKVGRVRAELDKREDVISEYLENISYLEEELNSSITLDMKEPLTQLNKILSKYT